MLLCTRHYQDLLSTMAFCKTQPCMWSTGLFWQTLVPIQYLICHHYCIPSILSDTYWGMQFKSLIKLRISIIWLNNKSINESVYIALLCYFINFFYLVGYYYLLSDKWICDQSVYILLLYMSVWVAALLVCFDILHILINITSLLYTVFEWASDDSEVTFTEDLQWCITSTRINNYCHCHGFVCVWFYQNLFCTSFVALKDSPACEGAYTGW